MSAARVWEEPDEGRPDGTRLSTAVPEVPVAGPLSAAVTALGVAVDEVVHGDLDTCTDAELRAGLASVQSALDRLGSCRTRMNGVLSTRALRAAGPGREEHALRRLSEDLGHELRLPASEIRKDGATGRQVAELPAVQRAMSDGDLPTDQARILTRTLQHIDDEVTRDQAEARLLVAGRQQDRRTFARTARSLLVEVDADAAQRRIDRQHTQRSLTATVDDEGVLQLHGNGAGLDAEYVQTALHAHRTHDVPGQMRTPGQRLWDALVALCRANLDAGTAPTDRAVRPHILITVAEPVVADRDGRGNGAARTPWSGDLPWTEVRRLLADAGVSRVLLDARGLPVEASEGVRSVPAAVWKAVRVRDQVCIADGCDTPAAWCEVMHLAVPFRFEGRLTIETAGLGCRYHHRKLDLGGWTVSVVAGRPILHHPDRPPRAGPAP
ncbi:MAG: DUF222 domain-containing protein [Nitriliruptor sp.]